jgi:hypothetical protein
MGYISSAIRPYLIQSRLSLYVELGSASASSTQIRIRIKVISRIRINVMQIRNKATIWQNPTHSVLLYSLIHSMLREHLIH